MTEALPEPMVPAGVDLTGQPWMPLYGHKLFGSEFNAACNDSEWRAGVTLWWAAWNQVPAASLPDDDVQLCRLADLGRDIKAWKKMRPRALHGFVKCSDGRLYHRALAALALDAWDRRVKERERKARMRAGQNRDVPRTETGTETGTSQGKDQGQPPGTTTGQAADVPDRHDTTRHDTKRQASPPSSSDPDERARRAGLRCLEILGRSDDPTWAWGVVHQWLADGCDPEKHIFPTLRAMVQDGRAARAKSLKYFTDAVMEARDRRAKAQGRDNAPTEETVDRLRRDHLERTGEWLPEWGPMPKADKPWPPRPGLSGDEPMEGRP